MTDNDLDEAADRIVDEAALEDYLAGPGADLDGYVEEMLGDRNAEPR